MTQNHGETSSRLHPRGKSSTRTARSPAPTSRADRPARAHDEGLALTTPVDLEQAFLAASPRLTPPRTPWRSVAIHGGATLLFFVLLTRAFVANNLFAWSAGLAYVGYDTVLIGVVFAATLSLRRPLVVPPAVVAEASAAPVS